MQVNDRNPESSKVTPIAPLRPVPLPDVPFSLECEISILGGLMLDPNAIERVFSVLKADMFYLSGHRQIYRAISDLYCTGAMIDLIGVAQWLSDRGTLDKAGGQNNLISLIENCPSAANIDFHAAIVADKWQRRQLIDVSAKISDLAQDCAVPLSEVLDESESKLFEVSQGQGEVHVSPVADVVGSVLEEIERRFSGGVPAGVRSGFYDLDAMTQGFQRSDLIIVAARPSMGKTALALNMARNIANDGLPVLVFSLEMSKEDLVIRLLSSASKIEMGRIRSGKITQQEWEPLGHAVSTVSQLPLHIDDQCTATVNDMRSRARKLQSECGGLGAIVIDYLQLMGGDSDFRVQELAKITRGLKGLARELKVPVIALSQLSRGVESRNDKRPMMSDLRECVTGDTLLTIENGQRVAISQLKPGQKVLAVNSDQKTVFAEVDDVWSNGVKPIYRLETSTGRVIRATEKHPFLTQRGYVHLKDLTNADMLAGIFRIDPKLVASSGENPLKARLLGYMIGNGSMINSTTFVTPCDSVKEDFIRLVDMFFPGANFNIGKKNVCWEIDVAYHYVGKHGKPFGNLLLNWLRDLGLVGKRSYEKFIPDWVFSLGADGAAEFLAGLLYTDGCVKSENIVALDTTSWKLASDTQALLTYLGIGAIVGNPEKLKKDHHHCMHRVSVSNVSLLDYAQAIPKIGVKGQKLNDLMLSNLENPKTASGVSLFHLPVEASKVLREKSLVLKQQGVKRGEQELKPWRDQGKRLSRILCAQYAKYLQDDDLSILANSDLVWESIKSIEPCGEEEVFDIRVPQTSNFVANGITVHNCGAIEQDADLIMMLYRDEYYNPESEDRGIAEVIICKHRNGPTGTVKLLFDGQYTQFKNMAGGRNG
jgi:replicative DNA helicase